MGSGLIFGLAQRAQVGGEVAGGEQGVGVVGAQHPTAPLKGAPAGYDAVDGGSLVFGQALSGEVRLGVCDDPVDGGNVAGSDDRVAAQAGLAVVQDGKGPVGHGALATQRAQSGL